VPRTAAKKQKKWTPPLFRWTNLHDLVANVADQEAASRAAAIQAKKIDLSPRPILPYTLMRDKKQVARLVAGIERGVANGQKVAGR
jgi:hypothetical protein